MKNILITGASGFVGTSLIEYLKQWYNISGVSRRASDVVQELDFQRRDDVLLFFSRNHFDVIIHLATEIADAKRSQNAESLLKNINIHINLAKALKAHQDTYLINFSSSSVYPNITGHFSELSEINSAPNTDCYYGLSKFISEMIFKNQLPQISQMHLRAGVIYGCGMNPSRIHPVFVKELAESNTITLFGEGLRIFPQIHIKSVVEKVRRLIEKKCCGTMNFADENISMIELANRIIKKYGNADSRIVLKPEGNKYQFQLDLSQYNQIFNV